MHTIDMGREQVRGRLRILGVAVVAVSLLLTACGGTATPAASETAAPTAAKATLAPATSAPTATQAATVVNVEAYENADGYFLKADQVVVPAGPVTFNFKNTGKLTHELMVYPVQDIATLLTLHRADKKADEMALLKGLGGMAEDVDAGKSASFNATLKPGFYELGCHARSKNADGTTYTHFDKGQFLTLAVTGPGGPAASVATPANTLAIQMTGEENASWLFSPDRLVVSAGDVTFKVTNGMKAEHDFVISPIGDTSKYVADAMMPGMAHNDDYSSFKGTELFEDLAPGKTESKTFKVTPGLWVAACYMVSKATDGSAFLHRDHGQRIVFMVK